MSLCQNNKTMTINNEEDRQKVKDYISNSNIQDVLQKLSVESDIEATIIRWNIDGTKTAGELTREIMLILKQQDNDKKI